MTAHIKGAPCYSHVNRGLLTASKYPGCAGRVQSAALRLVYDRQLAIEAFQPDEYWAVDAQLATADGHLVETSLHRVSLLSGSTNEDG